MKNKKQASAAKNNPSAKTPLPKSIARLIIAGAVIVLLFGMVQCTKACLVCQYGMSATGVVAETHYAHKSNRMTIEFEHLGVTQRCDYSGFIAPKKGEKLALWYHPADPCNFNLGVGDIGAKFAFTLVISLGFGLAAYGALKK